MTKLAWDKSGERFFEAGSDRGVLYVPEAAGDPLTTYRGVAWNGLTAVDEDASDTKLTSFHFDGTKYLIARTLGNYSASIKAYTYPDEFLEFDGIGTIVPGMFAFDQPVRKAFGLSYRTKIGNDIEGLDHGYKIHLAYRLSATMDARSYNTLSGADEMNPFGWKIEGLPMPLSGFRPTVHVVLDTRHMHPLLVQRIEEILYGNDAYDPRLPTPEELRTIISEWSLINIIDNGDGTWTAIGPDENVYYTDTIEPFINDTFYDDTSFVIEGGDATYLDENTYQIRSI